MARTGFRRFGLLAGLLLAAGLAFVVVHDVAKTPGRPTWEPVVHRSEAILETAAGTTACAGRPSRWIVLGWDGASWDLLVPLLEQGRMPHLAGLIENGVHGELYGFRPSQSPALWTSIATGVSPERHGVRGFAKRKHHLLRRFERIVRLGRVRTELYSNADRRVRALWNLLTEAGRRSLVVGYHNTFPAEAIEGLMVSNYLVQAHMSSLVRANESLPPEFRNSLVYPPEATGEVLRAEQRVRAALAGEITRFASFGPEELRRFIDGSSSPGTGEQAWEYFLRQAYLFDTIHAEIALEALPRIEPDVALVHFQGVDLVSHKLLYFHRPDLFRESTWPREIKSRLAELAPRYERTVGAFYEYLDEWLGRFLAARDGETAVMVLSDHGVEPTADPWDSGGHNEAPPGILVMQGPGVRTGGRVDGTLYDVLPTLLSSIGLPLADDLEGRSLAAFCEPLETQRVATFETEKRYQPRIVAPPGLTRQIEEQLRSLGYIR